MSKEKKEIESINYKYINSDLELVTGIPAIILFYWLPTIILMNIYSLIFSIFFTLVNTWLYRKGFTVIEFMEILSYIKRDPNPRLFPDEKK